MFSLTREGLLKGLGVCVIALGFFILANIATLTHIYVGYYNVLAQTLAGDIGLIWLRLAFEPLSGALIGVTLTIVGIGMLRLRSWARIIALILMYINFLVLACWIFFTQFQYIDRAQLAQVLVMYGLIITFLNLRWIKSAFA